MENEVLTKRCSHCKQELPLSDFYNNAAGKNGKQHSCKTCKAAFNKAWAKKNAQPIAAKQRRDHLKRTYGLDEVEYAKRLASQGGVCAICKTAEDATHWAGMVKNLHVDHDHQTGEVRGLLCDRCNRGLGFFDDSHEVLAAAQAYLKANKCLVQKTDINRSN